MQSWAIRNDPFLPQSQENGQVPVFKIPLEYSPFSGRGEGGACCAPGTAEEELRSHDRSGDNDLKLLLDQLGEISSGDEPYERRALHKSERRAKNRGRGKLLGVIAVAASVETSAEPFVLTLLVFFPHKQRDAPPCCAGGVIKQGKV